MARSTSESLFEGAIYAGAAFMVGGVLAGMYGISAHDGFALKQGWLAFCIGTVFLGLGGVARAVRS